MKILPLDTQSEKPFLQRKHFAGLGIALLLIALSLTFNPSTAMITRERIAIAESILGKIDNGYVTCPGRDLHSHPSGKRDCQIFLQDVPNIFCVHNSCAGVIAEKNRLLQSLIGKAECGREYKLQPYRPSPQEIQRERDRDRFERLKYRAEKSLAQIVSAHACDPYDLWEMSPIRLEGDAQEDWQLLLQLYRSGDVLWIGDEKESARDDHDDAWKEHCATRFKTAVEWLNSEPTGHHICPNLFKAGVYSRTAENITELRFLVVESDKLTKPESCGVLKWLSKILRMRAVIDTGGKSLHGWFEYPDDKAFKELKAILPGLGCDDALFQQAHTCRLPGPLRDTGRRQHLTYLDLEGVQ
jgi:hypothetical protein